MLAVRENGIFSVMNAPSSLIPFARFITRGSLWVCFFISREKLTMAFDGITSIMTSASEKTSYEVVACMLWFIKRVGKYFVFLWFFCMSEATSFSIVWRKTLLSRFHARRSATLVPNVPAPAITILFIYLPENIKS